MRKIRRATILLTVALSTVSAGAAIHLVQDQCGPFTDVSPTICPYVLEMYYVGITAGTSPTTYSPDNPVTRGQAAVFVTKGLNQSLARSSRRAALGQWWTTASSAAVTATTVGNGPFQAAADGADIWTANLTDGSVSRVRASDGKLLDTWTGATGASSLLVAMGRVFVVGGSNPGKLYAIDPTQPGGALSSVADLGINPLDIAFDGNRIWVTNAGSGGNNTSISIVQPGSWQVTNVAGPLGLAGLVFDGSNMWATANLSLLKLDSAGAVLQTVDFPIQARFPVFDGANIWVPTSNGAGGGAGRASVDGYGDSDALDTRDGPEHHGRGLRRAAHPRDRLSGHEGVHLERREPRIHRRLRRSVEHVSGLQRRHQLLAADARCGAARPLLIRKSVL